MTTFDVVVRDVSLHVGGATLALIGAAALDAALRARGPHALRAAIWWAALARLTLPFGPSIGVSTSVPFFDFASTVAPDAGSTPALPWTFVAATIWISGVAFMFGRLIAAERRFRRTTRRGRAAASQALVEAFDSALRVAGLRKAPRFVVTHGVASPCAHGIFRPTIYFPADFPLDDQAATKAATVHELVHVRRRDPLLTTALEVLRAVFWFHPLVALLVARLRELRELGCDEAAARAMDDAVGYRAALLAAAGREAFAAAPRVAPAWIAAPASILVRIRGLSSRDSFAERTARRVAPLVAVAAFACAPRFAAPAPIDADSFGRTAAAAILDARANGERVGCFELRFATFTLATPEVSPTSGPPVDR